MFLRPQCCRQFIRTCKVAEGRGQGDSMKPAIHASCLVLFAVVLMFAIGISSYAQDGKLNVRVTPHQAYIFVDGRAINEASKKHTLRLSAGDHKIELVNYGYAPDTRTVTITAGETSDIEVN